MQVLHTWEEAEAAGIVAGALTVGNFDGVHMGHQQVLAELKGHAEVAGGASVVVTFEPHPRAVLFPEESPRRLGHVHERLQHLERLGVDVVLLLEFNRELAAWTAEKFAQALYRAFHFRHMHVGYDFAFGRGREGQIADLRRMGDAQGFTVSEASAFEMLGAVVSSSRVRSAIEAADFAMAEQLLGRTYAISGEVLHGEQRGRAMNFPTANVDVAGLAHPPVGIYAVRASVGAEHWLGAAYLGYRPTFQGRTLLLETHLLDASLDLYGKILEVSFVRRIREDRTFTGADDLSVQIAQDCDAARTILVN